MFETEGGRGGKVQSTPRVDPTLAEVHIPAWCAQVVSRIEKNLPDLGCAELRCVRPHERRNACHESGRGGCIFRRFKIPVQELDAIFIKVYTRRNTAK